MHSDKPLPPFVYCSVSAYTVQLWELILQFDEEVRWIWPLSRWSWIKWTFLSSRYGSLTLQGALLYQTLDVQYHDYSPSACGSWFGLHVVTPSIIGALVQLTLISRIFALYSREIWVKRFLLCCYVTQMAAAFIIWIVTSHAPATYDSRCKPQSPPPKWPYIAVGFSSTALDCVLVTLNLVKVARLSHIANAPPVLRIIARDSIWAFVLITVATGATQVFVFLGDGVSQLAAVNWLLTVFSITATRLILNVLQLNIPPQTRQEGMSEQYAITEGEGYLTIEVPNGLSVFTQLCDDNSIQLQDVGKNTTAEEHCNVRFGYREGSLRPAHL